MVRITLNIEADDAADLRTTLAELAGRSVREMVEDGEIDIVRRPGANIHGLGPDEPRGLNPDYDPKVPLEVDVEKFIGQPDAGATQDAEPGERQRPKRRTKAEMEAANAALTAKEPSPTPDSAIPAFGDSVEVTFSPPPLNGPSESFLDDDSDAEGLEGLSEAQDRLDAEAQSHLSSIVNEALENPLPLETAAKPAASALGGQSAPSATDASPEPQAAPGPSPAPADDPVVAFCNSVGNCATWAEGKIALGALTKAHALEPHELAAARKALWNIPARARDKVDPGTDPTAFMAWLTVAPEEDQIDGTLQVLDRSDAWQRLNVAQRDKIKDAAAAAKRRLADKAAAE